MLRVKISWSLSNKRGLELVLQRSNNWEKKTKPLYGGSNPPKIPLYLSLSTINISPKTSQKLWLNWIPFSFSFSQTNNTHFYAILFSLTRPVSLLNIGHIISNENYLIIYDHNHLWN